MSDNQTRDSDRNICHLSEGDLEMIVDGETVGPWLFDGTAIYVDLDEYEREKIWELITGSEK